MATVVQLMTTDELLAMPDDGVERWLIEGQLREAPMSRRNMVHSSVMARASQALANWNDTQPEPRGKVLCGDSGVKLKGNPDTTVGIDVTYISAAVLAAQTGVSKIIQGTPTVAVEILSPSDKQEEIQEKVRSYLKAGVPHVWVIHAEDQFVLVYQPGEKPQFFNTDQELTAEPHLPGFRVAVARLFE